MSGIVRLDKVKSVTAGHIYNVVSTDALENGSIGYLNGLATGEREIYTLGKFATATIATKKPVLIAAPEINADESTYAKAALGAFVNPANVPVRAYELNDTDVFSVSADMVVALSTTPVVGNYLIATNASYKYSEVASLAGTEAFAAKIVALEGIGSGYLNTNTYTYVVCEVAKI